MSSLSSSSAQRWISHPHVKPTPTLLSGPHVHTTERPHGNLLPPLHGLTPPDNHHHHHVAQIKLSHASPTRGLDKFIEYASCELLEVESGWKAGVCLCEATVSRMETGRIDGDIFRSYGAHHTQAGQNRRQPNANGAWNYTRSNPAHKWVSNGPGAALCAAAAAAAATEAGCVLVVSSVATTTCH